MQKKTLFITLIMALCAHLACAQTAVLIISDTTEVNVPLLGGVTYDLPAPPDVLTVNAKHTPSTTTTSHLLLGDLKIEQYVSGEWEELYKDNPGIVTIGNRTVLGQTISTYEEAVDYETLTFHLNRRATQIRFSRTLTNDKQIKNLNVTMASFVETSPRSLNFGEMVVWSEPVTLPFYVEHCNVPRLNVSSSNPDFQPAVSTVLNSGIGQYMTDTFHVTFTPNIMGVHTGVIYVSNGTCSDSIRLTAKVTKRTPIMVFADTLLTVGDTIEAPLRSDCNNPFMLGSCESAVLEVSCGRLIARAPGVATLTAMQLGDDDYWNNKIDTWSVTVQAADTVPGVATHADAVNQSNVQFIYADRFLSAQADGLTSVTIYDATGKVADELRGHDYVSTRVFLPVGAYTAVAYVGTNTESFRFLVEE